MSAFDAPLVAKVPVILGHVMGLPVEETVLQAVVVGTATGTAVGLACRMMLSRLLTRLGKASR
jgi:hypothetical protein